MNITEMAEHYRTIRKAVFNEATLPADGSALQHSQNQRQLRLRVENVCRNANLSRFRGTDVESAKRLWNMLWTRIRYAGIKSSIATQEISDVKFYFDDYASFLGPEWDLKTNGHKLISAGQHASDFINRTGSFRDCQTIGNLPKLKKTILLARNLAKFMATKVSDSEAMDFVTEVHSANDVWSVHAHLLSIGYTADLTALHFMMDTGFQVMKPDIIVTRLFLQWGWLHAIIGNLPRDITLSDLEGRGKYKSRFKYTKSTLYKPVISLAKQISQATTKSDLSNDIGWVTDNPLREFDIFVVKYGQQPEIDFGIAKTLANFRMNTPLCSTRDPNQRSGN